MSVQLHEKADGKILEVGLSGTLTQEDYEEMTPQVERLIDEHGKIRMLVDMHDFEGWDANAIWDEIKFGLQHYEDIERLALVGDTKWQAGLAAFRKPFMTGEVRYFDHDKADEAHRWIEKALTRAGRTVKAK